MIFLGSYHLYVSGLITALTMWIEFQKSFSFKFQRHGLDLVTTPCKLFVTSILAYSKSFHGETNV